jgi:hypothetical protein
MRELITKTPRPLVNILGPGEFLHKQANFAL